MLSQRCSMAEVIRERRTSVAETLDQARRALQTHRTWMRKRSITVIPEVENADNENTQVEVDVSIFTRDSNQPLSLEDPSVQSRSREDVSMDENSFADIPAPPPSLEHTTSRSRVSKVAPSSLSDLPELPLGKGSLTGALSAFYGSEQDPILLSPKEGSGGSADSKKAASSQQRKRHGSSSKGRVAPMANSSAHESEAQPTTTPTSVFYSQTSKQQTPPTLVDDARSRGDDDSDTQSQQEPRLLRTDFPNSSSPPKECGSLSPDADTLTRDNVLVDSGEMSGHNTSSDLDMSASHVESLQSGRSSAHLVAVSPAPRDQRSSFSAHTQSKVRAVEESLQIVDKEAVNKMATPTIDTPPDALRLPVSERNLTSQSERSKVKEVESVFMRRVLPRVEETVPVTGADRQHKSQASSPSVEGSTQSQGSALVQTEGAGELRGAGRGEADLSRQGELEDIETVDLFSAPLVAKEERKTRALSERDTDPVDSAGGVVLHSERSLSPPPLPLTNGDNSSLSPTTDDRPPLLSPVNKESPPLQPKDKKDRASLPATKNSNPPLYPVSQNSKKLSVSIEPLVIHQTEANAIHGGHDLTVKKGGKMAPLSSQQSSEPETPVAMGEEKLRELKLPPLRDPKVMAIDGNEMVRNLPNIRSPLTPYMTGFTFSTKRERSPPPYTIHRPHGSLGLVPPCPPYGTTQPNQLNDLALGLANVPTRRNSSQLTTPSDTNRSLAKDMPSPSTEKPASANANKESEATESDRVSVVSESVMIPGPPSVSTMPTGPGPLHFAAKSGNLRRLQALINQGHDVDLPDQNGQTPLMYCIHSTGVHLSCADALIREGANVNRQSSDGSAAMHLASSMGGIALIELMILNGARTDVRDFEGRLPIHWATIQKKSSKVMAILLNSSEVGIDVTDDAGMTPLMWAAYNNNMGVTSFLLNKGADREEKDNDGYTAMHWAVHKEGTQCLGLLLKPDMTYFKDHRGKTVIHFAAEKGAMAASELILKMRPDAIFDTDKMGRTPLHYSAACSCVDVCALLLDRGADATQRDNTGRTPLDYARLKKLDYVVALLTCHGTAVADFARASRSTSVASLLDRAISFGQASGIRVSMTSLASQTSVEGSVRGLDISASSHTLTGSERPTTAGSVTSVGGEGVDVVRGGYMGRFVNDKIDPIKHYYFKLHPDWGTISWTRQRGDPVKTAEQVTILEVHEGPSNSVKQSTCYSPDELHRYVFWILTAGGVLDLLAYNQDDYTTWVRETRRVAMSNEDLGDTGQALRRQQRIKDSGVPSRPGTSQSRTKVAPSSLVEEASGVSKESGDISQKSKIFLASSDTVIVASALDKTPAKKERSEQLQSPRNRRVGIGTSPSSHVTSHMTEKPAGFRSDIFITSTPKEPFREETTDII